jgi:hypothetical protein
MRKSKRIYLIISLFLILFSVSSASAQTKSIQSQKPIQTDSQEIIQLGNKTIPNWPVCNPMGSIPCFSVGGTVSGLTGTTVLQKNGGNPTTISTDGPFSFSSLQVNGSPYSVIDIQQPTNQQCTVTNGNGSINNANVTNIAVDCQTCWIPTSSTGAPSARSMHSQIWTGNKMIVWGGEIYGGTTDTGAIYHPSTNTWTPMSSTNAPSARFDHSTVWTGAPSNKMIVWGGFSAIPFSNDGGMYHSGSNSWTATSLTGVPSGRAYHTAVWTGSEMIVWGGAVYGSSQGTGDGGRFNPSTNTWTSMSSIGAPSPRKLHSAVWTGSQMIVWGGMNGNNNFNDGSLYNPITDSWTPMSSTNAPSARFRQNALWTGSKMIIWGGENNISGELNDGALYDPVTNSWTPMSMVGVPSPRGDNSAIWTGSKMIVWGGAYPGNNMLNNGGTYNPTTNTWTTLCSVNAPIGRWLHGAVWTGSKMVIWGGDNGYGSSPLSDGAFIVP